jgi:hypothetical protein
MPGEMSRKADKFLSDLYGLGTPETPEESSPEDDKAHRRLMNAMLKHRAERRRGEFKEYMP